MSESPVKDAVLKAVHATPGVRIQTIHEATQQEIGIYVNLGQVKFALDCLEEEGLILGNGVPGELAKVWSPKKTTG